MAGTSTSSPYIKDEPEDNFFDPGHPRYNMGSSQQGYAMPQQHFNQFGASHVGDDSIDPSNLAMSSSAFMSQSFNNNYGAQSGSGGFSKGISSAFDDSDLADGLGGNYGDMHGMQQMGMPGNGLDYGNGNHFDDFGVSHGYNGQSGSIGMPMAHSAHLTNVYSSTPEGNPIQSPFVQNNFNQEQFRHMQSPQQYGSSLQSPVMYPVSPQMNADIPHAPLDTSYNMAKAARPRLGTSMSRKSSHAARSPLTPKTASLNVGALKIGSPDDGSFAQPIGTMSQGRDHQRTMSDQWLHTPSSMNTVLDSQFSSQPQLHVGMHPNPQISEILKDPTRPASLPAKVSNGHGAPPMQSSQEMKRRRRRESHNLVERRRRDNINERIQELSHLVPLHRLEDERVRKHIQNNSPLSPTLGPSTSPPQATSGLAGPGARRATGNITQGIPVEEKDKGPNKGDILNGAVGWTRDLMWYLHLKLQQAEVLAACIADLGGDYPFEQTEEELRMQTELMEAMEANNAREFAYTRAPGSGLRVPQHTDYKGDPIAGNGHGNASGDADGGLYEATSLSPDNHSTGGNEAGQLGMGGPGQYWSGHNSGGSGAGSVGFKEEDEYGMDLTQ